MFKGALIRATLHGQPNIWEVKVNFKIRLCVFTLLLRLPANYCRLLFSHRLSNRCQTDRGYDATTTDTNAAFKTTEL